MEDPVQHKWPIELYKVYPNVGWKGMKTQTFQGCSLFLSALLIVLHCTCLEFRLVYSYFEKVVSEKVHATILKGIVGSFEFTFLQRNLKECHERPWTYVCECSRKATKAGSTLTVSGTVYWSYPILPFGIVACTFFPTTFLETAVYNVYNQ